MLVYVSMCSCMLVTKCRKQVVNLEVSTMFGYVSNKSSQNLTNTWWISMILLGNNGGFRFWLDINLSFQQHTFPFITSLLSVVFSFKTHNYDCQYMWLVPYSIHVHVISVVNFRDPSRHNPRFGIFFLGVLCATGPVSFTRRRRLAACRASRLWRLTTA